MSELEFSVHTGVGGLGIQDRGRALEGRRTRTGPIFIEIPTSLREPDQGFGLEELVKVAAMVVGMAWVDVRSASLVIWKSLDPTSTQSHLHSWLL